MAFDFASAKGLARRVVHSTFGVPAFYSDPESGIEDEVTVRFHTKIERFGDLQDRGWAEIVTGLNRLILDKIELQDKNILPRRGAKVRLQPRGFEDVVVVLEVAEPDTGPVTSTWQVALA